jgi:hypothetical protein
MIRATGSAAKIVKPLALKKRVGRICMRSFAKILRAACVARKIDQDVL